MLDLHPEHDWALLANDAVTAIDVFTAALEDRPEGINNR